MEPVFFFLFGIDHCITSLSAGEQGEVRYEDVKI